MMTRKLNHTVWSVGLIVCLLSAFVLPGSSLHVAALGKEGRTRALLATVRLAAPIDGEQDAQSTGSGTIVSADGYILTSYSVVGNPETAEPFNSDGLVYVAVTPADLKGLPTWTYKATLVQGDPRLDLAVLKIDAPFNGSGELPANLGLITMVLGDSDSVAIGDEVSIIGYAQSTGASVGFTSGSMTGLLDTNGDAQVEGFSTDAKIDAGSVGGAAIDEAGEMVGMPCLAADGTPFIRAINLASTLIDAATTQLSALPEATPAATTPSEPPPVEISSGAGAAVEAEATPTVVATAAPEVTPEAAATVVVTGTETLTPTVEITPEPSGPRITDLVFSDRVDRRGNPGATTTSFDAGVQTVYAVFTYEAFEDALPFLATWSRDGEDVSSEDFAWDGGESGSSWITMADNNGIAGGDYVLTLTLDGVELISSTFTVAEPAPPPAGPSLSALVFAEDVMADGQPVNPHQAGEPFASGIDRVYAIFDYSGMQNGMTVSRDWLLDGEVAAQAEESWEHGESGTQWVFVTADPSLPTGTFGLRMYIDGELAIEGEFEISGEERTSTEPVFGSIVFAEGVTDDGQPVSPHGGNEPFGTGITQVCAFFDYSGMENGMAWSHHWYIDNVEVAAADAEDTWGGDRSGNDWLRIYSSGSLPEGHYRLEILVGDTLVTDGEFDLVGDGGTDGGEGVQLAGWLLDADTWQPIPGAEIVALKPGIKVRTFLRSPREEMVYSWGQADDEGYFVLDVLLERNEAYSFVAYASGYQDLSEDDVLIEADSPSYDEWEIYLQRR